jgi:integrase
MADNTPKSEKGGRGSGSKWELPSGSWRIQFYVEGQRYTETVPTADAADARLEEIARLKAAHIDVGGGMQTVTDFFSDWLDQRDRSAKSQRTKSDDRRNVQTYIVPAIGDMRIGEVRSRRLQDLLNAVEDGVRERTKGHHSGKRTAQLVGTLLQQAFDAARDQRLIPFSPMDGVIIPTYDRAEVVPADDVGVASVLLHAAKMPLPALWYSYVCLGLRRNEGIAIRIKDVDLEHRTILIAQQVQVEKGGVFSFPLPKGKKMRLLPYPRLMTPWLEQQMTEVKRLKLKAGGKWHDHDLLFCSDDGDPLWPSTIDRWWRELRDAVGIAPELHLHSLRHSFMTMLDETQLTEARKKRIMGHGKSDITEKYTHPGVEVMRRAIEEVAERVVRAMEKRQAATG